MQAQNSKQTNVDQEWTSTLNHLIEVSKDGEKGYLAASEDSPDPSTKDLLLRFSEVRGKFVQELQPLAALGGETPKDSGSIQGAIHRGWINLKSTLASRETLAVLEECEVGDSHAFKVYTEAIATKTLGQAESVVQNQLDRISADLSQIKLLKQQAALKPLLN